VVVAGLILLIAAHGVSPVTVRVVAR
jgi:hypothetical protein